MTSLTFGQSSHHFGGRVRALRDIEQIVALVLEQGLSKANICATTNLNHMN